MPPKGSKSNKKATNKQNTATGNNPPPANNDSSGSASARQDTRSPPPEDTAKRAKTSTESDMAVDIPAGPSPTVVVPAPHEPLLGTSSSLPVSRVEVITPSTLETPLLSTTSLETSFHVQATSTSDKGKNKEVSFVERVPSPDASLATIQAAGSSKFYAATDPGLAEGFWEAYPTNSKACDATDRIFSKYSSYCSRASTTGSRDANTKRIIICFSSESDRATAISAPISELKNLQFHQHDPDAIKIDQKQRTLFVTDIPLFTTADQLRGAFSRFGNISHCRLFTKKLYQHATITYDDTTAVDYFADVWSAIVCGFAVRVVPECYTADQRQLRRDHVALLAGLPKDCTAADLEPILLEIKGKHAAIPLSLNSYRPKPYAYISFASAELKDSAMDVSCSVKNRALTWHSTDTVTSLCHICGRLSCDPKACPSRAQRHQPVQRDDKVTKLYNRFKPANFRSGDRSNRFSRGNNRPNHGFSNSRNSRSRSRSENTSRRQPRHSSTGQLDTSRPWNKVVSSSSSRQPYSTGASKDDANDDMFGPDDMMTDLFVLRQSLGALKDELHVLRQHLTDTNTRVSRIERFLNLPPLTDPSAPLPIVEGYNPSRAWDLEDDNVNFTADPSADMITDEGDQVPQGSPLVRVISPPSRPLCPPSSRPEFNSNEVQSLRVTQDSLTSTVGTMASNVDRGLQALDGFLNKWSSTLPPSGNSNGPSGH